MQRTTSARKCLFHAG